MEAEIDQCLRFLTGFSSATYIHLVIRQDTKRPWKTGFACAVADHYHCTAGYGDQQRARVKTPGAKRKSEDAGAKNTARLLAVCQLPSAVGCLPLRAAKKRRARPTGRQRRDIESIMLSCAHKKLTCLHRAEHRCPQGIHRPRESQIHPARSR